MSTLEVQEWLRRRHLEGRCPDGCPWHALEQRTRGEPVIDNHHPPESPIGPAVKQFIADHDEVIGFEAWQTFNGVIGTPGIVKAFKESLDRESWNEVAKAVLEDFAVWYDAGHYRDE